tara:strand:- start:1245 stop:1463 length:219 start_codon:yes stop_codon:yes gene_type:complete
MKYIYQLRNYMHGLPATGRLFYAILSYLVDLIILVLIVDALDGGPKWESMAILTITLAYATYLDTIWKWIEG